MRKMLLFLIVSFCVVSCTSVSKLRGVDAGGPSPMSYLVKPENHKNIPEPVILPRK